MISIVAFLTNATKKNTTIVWILSYVYFATNTLDLCFGDKILHIWRTRRRRRKIFLQVGLILQVESSFNAQMQTQIIAQIQQGTNPDSIRNKGGKKKTLAQIEQARGKKKR